MHVAHYRFNFSEASVLTALGHLLESMRILFKDGSPLGLLVDTWSTSSSETNSSQE